MLRIDFKQVICYNLFEKDCVYAKNICLLMYLLTLSDVSKLVLKARHAIQNDGGKLWRLKGLC